MAQHTVIIRLILPVFLCFAAGACNSASLTVYVPEKPSLTQQFAFEELAHYLGHLSGTAVVQTDTLQKGDILLLTAETLPENLKDAVSVAETPESFHLRRITDDGQRKMVICGRDERGLLYGVYEFIEQYMAKIQGNPLVDISFEFEPGSGKDIDPLALELDLNKTPFYPIRGLHLDFISLGAKAMLGSDPSQPKDKEVWRLWSDWCARHRINFMSSWPYGKTNWWELVPASVLPNATALTAEQIEQGIDIRRRLLDYSAVRQIDTYLMNYVPGKGSPEMTAAYPHLFTQNEEKDVSRFCYAQKDLWTFFTDVIEAVTKTYPQMTGFNLRRWGESYPCECNFCKGRDAELSRQLLQKMIEKATAARQDVKLLFSGYMDPQYAVHFPDSIVCMIKWGNDWDPSPDPGRSADYLKSYGNKGVIIDIALPCEESFPLGLIEHTYLDAGIKQYALQADKYPNLKGFAAGFGDSDLGFLTELNYIVFARLTREPAGFDTQAFCRAYLSNKFGAAAADAILESMNIQADVWFEFFCSKDRGGLEFLNLAPYSSWARFGDLYTSFPHGGTKAFDYIQKQDTETLRQSLNTLNGLSARQNKAAGLVAGVSQSIPSRSVTAYQDYRHQTGGYLSYLESRRALLKSVLADRQGQDDVQAAQLKLTVTANAALLEHLKAKPNNVGYGDQGGNIADWELERLVEGIEDENARIQELINNN